MVNRGFVVCTMYGSPVLPNEIISFFDYKLKNHILVHKLNEKWFDFTSKQNIVVFFS